MTTTPTIPTINIQDYLRQPLKIVRGCKDYHEEEELLKNVDDVLKLSGLERLFIELSTSEFKAKSDYSGSPPSNISFRKKLTFSTGLI